MLPSSAPGKLVPASHSLLRQVTGSNQKNNTEVANGGSDKNRSNQIRTKTDKKNCGPM